MEYRKLGNTDISVSRICMGTMTFGEQNSEEDAHEQLDYAVSQGINFIDTAEMYPVPGKKETQGLTEKYIGTWLKKRGIRDKVIVASKATGPNPGLAYIRNVPSFAPDHLTKALEGSLKRLQTDYIDLYQLHWPERKTNCFGKLGFVHKEDEWEDNFQEVLTVLQRFQKEGKIRHVGLSNETPWGLMRCLHLAAVQGLPPVVSIQNPYNLLNRSFEVGLSEIVTRENIAMLAYSPMAFGVLSGKYLKNTADERSRLNLFPKMQRYNKPQVEKAAQSYVEIAEKHGLSPASMALAFVNQRPFVTSNIIGATTMQQLKENIGSIHVKLDDSVLEEIEGVHERFSIPAP
ncbi:NADP(H)-dependent aldo-keto reductase [Cytophagaceae bacterium ABcell3]|nr:NADP(H)-dependent aldo-keto reductase [Cytophagaceae bacterium ABcell3]